MSEFFQYKKCRLCARNCGVNRYEQHGYCASSADMHIARAALHMWEEPPVSGTCGSGTIFFCGCSLGCVFCQNREISRGNQGRSVSINELSQIMLKLQGEGAHNINLVTPTHYVPSIIEAVAIARKSGLSIPIVYNTGSYDSIETLRSLDGVVDVYLPDFKYYRSKTASEYSFANDYVDVAKCAISEMVRQRGTPKFDCNGIIISGVIVRILLLPGHLAEAKLTLKYIFDSYGNSVYISLMSQYTPPAGMKRPLDRKVTRAEYRELISYAESIGLKNGFYQDIDSADESFIPAFDGTGLP